jgi:aspartate aminotransferase-like enzyme
LSLFTPGPVDISAEAREGLITPVMHHRSARFGHMMAALAEGLKVIFRTGDEVAVVSSSGTGAMEAAVVNLFSPGDHVLVPVSGKFSGRWAEICKAYGLNVSTIDLPWGGSPVADEVVGALQKNERIVGLLLTHCETSTGSLTDVESIGQAVHEFKVESGRQVITCADCIASLCVDEFRKDEWRIDCAIGVSHKGLLSPPGLAFVAVNEKAWVRMQASRCPRYYFDLSKYLRVRARSPFTPAVSAVQAVSASLERILKAGLEAVLEANASAARGLGRIMQAAELSPVAGNRSNAVGVYRVGDLDAEAIGRIMSDRYGIQIAQGQGILKGKVIRVSAMGKSPREMLLFAEAFEGTMTRLGRPFRIGDIEEDLNKDLRGSRLWE